MALATLKNMRVFAWDVDSTYLHGRIDHDVYVTLPDGYGKSGKAGQLNKVIYGLLEAAQVWRKDLETNLKKLGFVPLGSDTDVFLKKSETGVIVIDTHVDDNTGICSSEEEELCLKEGIKKSFKIKEKDTSKPFKVLGILVTRNTCLEIGRASCRERV